MPWHLMVPVVHYTTATEAAGVGRLLSMYVHRQPIQMLLPAIPISDKRALRGLEALNRDRYHKT